MFIKTPNNRIKINGKEVKPLNNKQRPIKAERDQINRILFKLGLDSPLFLKTIRNWDFSVSNTASYLWACNPEIKVCLALLEL